MTEVVYENKQWRITNYGTSSRPILGMYNKYDHTSVYITSDVVDDFADAVDYVKFNLE